MDLLISAVRFEVVPLLDRKEAHGLSFTYHECGIGPLHAAASTPKLVEVCQNKRVVFVGTCGIFGPFETPDMISVDEVLWQPTCERLGYAYGVKDLHPSLKLKNRTFFREGVLPQAKCVCSPSISTASLKGDVSAAILVENLELYSVAMAVIPVAKSFDAILCVTNAIGPAAHEQWKANFKTASQMTAELCDKVIFAK